MNNVAKNRWQVRIAALIIFVLGFTAGILALNVYRGLARGGQGNRIDELAERLQLFHTPELRFDADMPASLAAKAPKLLRRIRRGRPKA